MTRSALRPDLNRLQISLDALPAGTVIADQHGDAWQKGVDYWYRAYNADGEPSFSLAQYVGAINVLRKGRRP